MSKNVGGTQFYRTPQYISNIVVGKKNMSLESAEIFAEILEVREEYLLCQDRFKNKSAYLPTLVKYWEESEQFYQALLKRFGISVIKTIVITEEVNRFELNDTPRMLTFDYDLIGRKVNISGMVQTPKSLFIGIEINHKLKEIPLAFVLWFTGWIIF